MSTTSKRKVVKDHLSSLRYERADRLTELILDIVDEWGGLNLECSCKSKIEEDIRDLLYKEL